VAKPLFHGTFDLSLSQLFEDNKRSLNSRTSMLLFLA